MIYFVNSQYKLINDSDIQCIKKNRHLVKFNVFSLQSKDKEKKRKIKMDKDKFKLVVKVSIKL